MNLGIKRAKNHIIRQKKVYSLFILLVLISILAGALFLFALSKNDTMIVKEELSTFFNNIKMGNNINYVGSLINSIVTNLGYLLLIWLLGISIIGFPFILILIFIKGFILGFSISSIIATYGVKGILGAFLYICPHQLIFMVLLILIGFYACSFCIKLFKYLFLKQNINFKIAMHKYLKILFFAFVVAILLSLFETFISTYLIRLFTMII